jgi:asparagine synthase (glutamine-hydrolysing)
MIFNNKFDIYGIIYQGLYNAVKKRVSTTDRPIACLLSGGLDSSLITALINEEHKKYSTQPLETYSIGLKGSEDLRCAKIVADYLETNHTEIIVSEDDMFSIIPHVIYAIESYDTTTVRASIGNYLLGKYISKNSSAKVIFNGDGSDEICGGYLYMNLCPDAIEYDKETRRLLKDIYFFDVLRSDKCISSHGLEPRTPFLDRSFVDFYLSIPPKIRHDNPEKYLLRSAFSIENYHNRKGLQLLPNSILWRRKEAFSDGVSGTGNSLYQILQKFISTEMNMYPPSIEMEKKYYKELFLKYYPSSDGIIPYYWMPKYTKNTTDPSARTLSIY